MERIRVTAGTTYAAQVVRFRDQFGNMARRIVFMDNGRERYLFWGDVFFLTARDVVEPYQLVSLANSRGQEFFRY